MVAVTDVRSGASDGVVSMLFCLLGVASASFGLACAGMIHVFGGQIKPPRVCGDMHETWWHALG